MTDIQEALIYSETLNAYRPLDQYIKIFAGAYRELSAKYDRLMEAAMVMYNDLDLHYPNNKGIDMMEELL